MKSVNERKLIAARRMIEGGKIADATSVLVSIISAAVLAEDQVTEASARGLVAQAQLLSGQPEVAERHAKRGLAIAQELEDADGAAFFQYLLEEVKQHQAPTSAAELLILGRVSLEDRDQSGAIKWLEAAAKAADAEGDDRAKTTAIGHLARAFARVGRWKEALPLATEAFELARQHGSRSAVAHFRELSDRIRRREEPQVAGQRFSVLITEQMDRANGGDIAGPTKVLDALLAEAHIEGARGPEASIHHVLAQLYELSGDRNAAFGHASEGEAIARQLEDTAAIERFEVMVSRLTDA